jgi:hypothetical protein
MEHITRQMESENPSPRWNRVLAVFASLAPRPIILPDEGHGAQKRENQVLQLGHMVRFFEEHLLGKKSSARAEDK